MKKLKKALLLTGKILLVCILVFPVVFLLSLIPGISADVALSVPLFSGFIHGSVLHLSVNMVLLFLLLLYGANDYTFTQVLIITTIISCIYFPFIFFGANSSVGISGFCYFLLARFLFSYKKIKWLFISLGILLVLFEISTINDSDGIAHGSHLIGFALGVISLFFKLRFLNPRDTCISAETSQMRTLALIITLFIAPSCTAQSSCHSGDASSLEGILDSLHIDKNKISILIDKSDFKLFVMSNSWT